jgi:hypothetical protein
MTRSEWTSKYYSKAFHYKYYTLLYITRELLKDCLPRERSSMLKLTRNEYLVSGY